jgi:hypothetical protein
VWHGSSTDGYKGIVAMLRTRQLCLV